MSVCYSLQFNAHDLKKRTCDKAIKKRLQSSMNSALDVNLLTEPLYGHHNFKLENETQYVLLVF